MGLKIIYDKQNNFQLEKHTFLLSRKLVLIGLLGFILVSCSQKGSQDMTNNLKLWYDKPAEHFEQSLVLGNGKVGASIFGGVSRDSIYLNDITLWSGEPVDPNMNPEAHKYIPLIREALAKDDYRAADSLSRYVQGKFSQSFAPLGTLYLDFGHKGEFHDYRRELDISTAIAETKYNIGDVNYERTYLVSNPDNLMMIELRADNEKTLDFKIGFNSLLKYETTVRDETFKVTGYAPYHAEPNYRGNIANAVLFDKDRGTKFTTLIKIKETDGILTLGEDGIKLEKGSYAVVLVSVETSFNGFDKDPAKQGKDHQVLAMQYLAEASKRSVERIKKDHKEDYSSLFNRLHLDIGTSNRDSLTTDQRLREYGLGANDPDLEELYFHFGRYLLICSSRTEGVPANLQGLWNPYLRPPWSSNYTVNINVEENYWLAETANLSELHLPFLSWVKNVSKTGSVTASTFLGVDEGWMACHNSDIWAISNPVGDFGNGHPVWANWYMGGGWLSTHIWEHFSFTQDVGFLKEYYPILKGSAQFCLNWLVELDGELVTSPGSSPENRYLTTEGYKGATLYGATADIAIIREVFDHTMKAAKLLDRDHELYGQLNKTMARLRPYKIGEKGNLQEWYHDWEDVDPKHRHQTHLFGLYPGHQIDLDNTPDLASAAKRSLEIKGDESTGWSKGWRINLWARLRDGNHAYKMYRELLSYVDPSGLKTDYSSGGGTYPNLLDAHPPFQIDGNFGGAAGVLEMLVQSTDQQIEILPALPDSWSSGSLKGVKGRGGFELAFGWKEGTLTLIKIKSLTGNPCKLRYKDKEVELSIGKGQEMVLDGNLEQI